jgi:hypothetical protein
MCPGIGELMQNLAEVRKLYLDMVQRCIINTIY